MITDPELAPRRGRAAPRRIDMPMQVVGKTDQRPPTAIDDRRSSELGMDGRFNLVYSGNMGHFQGLDSAIRAAAKLRHLERFQLVFVGSGQAEPDLKRLAAELGLENVRFLGRHPFAEMGHITALASALLVSLEDRPFFAATIPSKTQVALACGRPLVMAVRGDAADLVTRAGAGVVCEPDNAEALAAAFEHLYSLPFSELDAMGSRGRDYYERELSFDQSARRLESLLEAAARERRRGDAALIRVDRVRASSTTQAAPIP